MTLILWLSGCACALDDADKAAGKPSAYQCVVASLLESQACAQRPGGECR